MKVHEMLANDNMTQLQAVSFFTDTFQSFAP